MPHLQHLYLPVLLPVPPSVVARGPLPGHLGLGCVDLWRLVCALLLFVAFVCAWLATRLCFSCYSCFALLLGLGDWVSEMQLVSERYLCPHSTSCPLAAEQSKDSKGDRRKGQQGPMKINDISRNLMCNSGYAVSVAN